MGIETILLPAGDSKSFKKVQISGRYMSIVDADYAIEINAYGKVGQNDGADQIKFGAEYLDGGELLIRNTSEHQNKITLNSAAFESNSRKVATVNADLSDLTIAGGQVGIDAAKNGIRVLNSVTLGNVANGVKIPVSTDAIEINNFPASFAVAGIAKVEVTNQLPEKKYNVSFVGHNLTASEAAAGWSFNSGNASKLVLKASRDVVLGSQIYFAEGEAITLDNLAANQNFVFKGVTGQTVSIIKYMEVI